MLLFWIVVGALSCAATASLALPLLLGGRASSRTASSDDEARRVAIYRDRRAEIEAERDSGRLTDDEARRALDDLISDAAVQLPGADAANAGTAPSADHGTSRTRLIALALVAALVVPLGSLLVYASIGSPSVIGLDTASLRGEITPQRLQQAIDELRDRVAKAPNDGEAWAMLAQAERFNGDLPAAVAAFERASALITDSAPLLAEHAETVMLAQRGDFGGRPVQLLERALAIDPRDTKSVALMGAAQYRLGNLNEALRYMRQLAAGVAPGSQEEQHLREVIAKIESELPGGTTPAPRPGPLASQAPAAGAAPGSAAGTAAPAGPAAASATISGSIAIDDALRASVPPGATVFVIARPTDGSRVPLAALRTSASGWPLRFELGDAQAMDPSRLLSSAQSVVVEARISLGGGAMRQSGDPFGTSVPVAPGAREVAIRIDQKVP